MRTTDTDMGTLGGFAPPFGPPPAAPASLASLGLAKPFGPPPATTTPLAPLGLARWCAAGEGARSARGGQGGLSVPKPLRGGAGGLPTRLTWEPWEGSQTFPRWFAAGKAGGLPTRLELESL